METKTDFIIVDPYQSGPDYIYKTSFEEWTVGEYLVLNDESGFWTTWTNSPGGVEDALITDDQASSPTQSVDVNGSTDLILKLGDKTSGKYQLNVKYWIVPDNAGYINIQHFQNAPGTEYAFEVYFGATGDGYMNAGGDNAATFTYLQEQWIQLKMVFDLDNDWTEFYIDDELIYEWQFSLQAQGVPGTLQLGGFDIYAGAPEGETAHYYFDDVEYIVLVEGTTPQIMDVDDSPVSADVENGDTYEETFSLANIGVDDLNYDITVIYPMGNNAMDKEPAGVHAAKDSNVAFFC